MASPAPTPTATPDPAIVALQQQVATLTAQVAAMQAKTGPLVVIPKNVDCVLATYTSTKANTKDPVPHSLHRVPQGYIVIGQNGQGTCYTAANSSPTATSLFLESTIAGTVYQLLLF